MSAMTLSLLVPLSAAGAYAVLGWRQQTRWLAALAGAVLLVWSVLVLIIDDGGVGRHHAAFIAGVGAASTLAGVMLPKHVAHELADQKIGPKSARWAAALTMAVQAVLVIAILLGDIGLSWLAVALTVVPTAALMTYQRQVPGQAAARRMIKAVAVPIAIGLIGAAAMWLGGASGWAMILLGLALMAQVAGVPGGMARIGVMSHLPAPSAIMVFVCVPIAAGFVVIRWSGQAAVVLGVTGVRSLLLVAGMLVLAAAIAAMLWSRDLRSLVGYTATAGGGFALLLAAGGPETAGQVAVFTGAFGAVVASLVVATADVIRVVGSSRMRLVAGWRHRSRDHATVMIVALSSTIGIPIVALWFSHLDRWGMWPPAAVAVAAMAAAVAVAGRRLTHTGPHPHLAVAATVPRPAGLPVMVCGLAAAVAVMVVVTPMLR